MTCIACLRRSFVIIAVALIASAPARGPGAPPNVVLIVSDDQGWGDYSFMGHPQIRTPNIDKLAAQGATFRRGYVPSSLCSPSLASILTGLYPHQHRVTSNDPPMPEGQKHREANKDPGYRALRQEMIANFERVPTLPRLLAEKGYASFQSGKWWGGNYQRAGFTAGMTHGDPDRGGRHGDSGLAIGRQGMQPVLDFIDASTDRHTPFFLWYAPMMPHSPHTPPDRLLDKYKEKAPTLEVAKYWAMCEWFDETCGTLLDHLDRKEIAGETLVIYVCDNGWIQDPDADRYAPRSKQSPYDGGLRTPIMVRWPGKVSPRMSDHRVLSIDIAPTILDAVGLKPTPAMSGVNLLDDAAVAGRKAIFGEVFDHAAVDIHEPSSSLRYRWVVADDWKLILPAARNSDDAEVKLFDLARDPGEARNLADDRPEKVAELKAMIDQWWPAEG